MTDADDYSFETADAFTDGLANLQPAHVNKVMAFLRDYARYTPTKPIPGKLKALKGTWRGYYEYHLSKSIRLRYWVDEENRVVKLRYLGKHNEWRYSQDEQGR